MQRRGLVAANWKMNGRKDEVDRLLDSVLDGLSQAGVSHEQCEVLICPPSVYLAQAQAKLSGSSLMLGAQNVHTAEKGAFTGEISATMLTDFGCSYVLTGHSERRELFGESDELVAHKFEAIRAQDMIPVLCVGETREQREAGDTQAVVLRQLEAVLEVSGIEAFDRAVVAYEPVWAIGTGLTATPQQAQEVHRMIRAFFAERGEEIAAGLRLLYGGSVKADNAAALFAEDDIDGALVGGASLDAGEFVAICRAMASRRQTG